MSGLPVWFKQEIPDRQVLSKIALLSEFGVHTVCQQAHCPNLSDCFRRSEITFMLLGDTCSRNCKFCAVHKLDLSEPLRIAETVKKLALSYVVITSVTRDDLEDGGAGQFAKTLELIHGVDARIKVETLIPDFGGNPDALRRLLAAGPSVVAHNMETVRHLYQEVRPEADYNRSLEVLARIKKIAPGAVTKSSVMLGMGESESEIVDLMKNLRESSCDIITLGQYLAPSRQHYPLKGFVAPEEFTRYKDIALTLGFKAVLSAPLVRSSYQAQKVYRQLFQAA
jgi:lipoic acid synthetase